MYGTLLQAIESRLRDLNSHMTFSMERFDEEFSSAKNIFEIASKWQDSKEAAQHFVKATADDIVNNGNFDGLFWDKLTKSCMISVYKALNEKIDLKKYLTMGPSNVEDIRQMIIASDQKDDNMASKALLYILFKVRTNIASDEDKKFYDEFCQDSERKRLDFISLFEYHPEVVKNGHTGSSMYFVCNEWLYIFANGWPKYVQLRLENLGINKSLM